MKSTRRLAVSSLALCAFLFAACAPSLGAPLPPQYLSPVEGAQWVSAGEAIAVRYGPELSRDIVAGLSFSVAGSKSGAHPGHTILADDHKTVIFKPGRIFTPGERVTVDISSLHLGSQATYAALSYAFDVALKQQSGSPGSAQGGPPTNTPTSAFPHFLTVPQDIPHYTVSASSSQPDEGDIFVSPFYWTKSTVGSYLLILNEEGQLVYWRSVADDLAAFDFKVQPNGMLSYFSEKDSAFYLLDSHYQPAGTVRAGNGYTTDLHDLQILPNGNTLLMIYDAEAIDMSRFARGGKPDAMVTGLVIQELDPSNNVIFEWRSWDHFAFTDSTSSLTDENIDLVHGNALAVSNDGNLLLSSRNQSEITKIDLQTGAVLWRFGGKANMFQLNNGQPFAFQHDVRQLPNGDITVFDNQGTIPAPASSHAIEYRLDEAAKTATVVWDFVRSPPVFATFMGNNQRLPSGNTFLSWGAPFTKQDFTFDTITEVTPDKRVLLDLTFDQPYVSYRAFRFAWQASPANPPDLAFRIDDGGITLAYSWNGATDVSAYKLFGGSSAGALHLIEQKSKTDFETQSHLSHLAANECYFQVAALANDGTELARSRIISTDNVTCPPAL